MDPALLTALAALAGSIVGGPASFVTTFFTQRRQTLRDMVSKEAANREELYSQFIKETTNQYIDLLDKTQENPVSLIGVYSLVGRIRLIAGDKVLLAAEGIVDSIVDSYSRPPKTFDDAYKLAREGRVDPLRELTEAGREEVALSPRRPKTVAFGILFWFTAPGPMVPAGRAFTTFLSKMATTSV
jgi:hypothetical protein